MYKLIIEIPEKLWAVVNVKNITQKITFFSRAHALSVCAGLNDGSLNFNQIK